MIAQGLVGIGLGLLVLGAALWSKSEGKKDDTKNREPEPSGVRGDPDREQRGSGSKSGRARGLDHAGMEPSKLGDLDGSGAPNNRRRKPNAASGHRGTERVGEPANGDKETTGGASKGKSKTGSDAPPSKKATLDEASKASAKETGKKAQAENTG